MKKFLVVALALAVGAAACAPKRVEGTKLAAGTPAYKLAQDLAKVLPAFDPDKNAVLVTTKKFTVTAGDVVRGSPEQHGQRGRPAGRARGRILEGVRSSRPPAQIAERKLL